MELFGIIILQLTAVGTGKILNAVKSDMVHWYQKNRYHFTPNEEYLVTKSYNTMLTNLERLKEADLIWTKAMQPKHRFIIWLTNQNKLLTKDRLQRL